FNYVQPDIRVSKDAASMGYFTLSDVNILEEKKLDYNSPYYSSEAQQLMHMSS
ncbi:hypothetical protein BGZ76_000272, partial [Entomortierella beljakovae]